MEKIAKVQITYLNQKVGTACLSGCCSVCWFRADSLQIVESQSQSLCPHCFLFCHRTPLKRIWLSRLYNLSSHLPVIFISPPVISGLQHSTGSVKFLVVVSAVRKKESYKYFAPLQACQQALKPCCSGKDALLTVCEQMVSTHAVCSSKPVVEKAPREQKRQQNLSRRQDLASQLFILVLQPPMEIQQ